MGKEMRTSSKKMYNLSTKRIPTSRSKGQIQKQEGIKFNLKDENSSEYRVRRELYEVNEKISILELEIDFLKKMIENE